MKEVLSKAAERELCTCKYFEHKDFFKEKGMGGFVHNRNCDVSLLTRLATDKYVESITQTVHS